MRTFIAIILSLAVLQLAYGETLRPQVSGSIADGIYTLTDAASGLNLAIKDKSTEEGATLTVAKTSDSNSQKFFVKKVTQDSFYITNILSNKYLTYTAEGVIQKTLAYTKEQEWAITKTAQGNYLLESKTEKKHIEAGKEDEKVSYSTDAKSQGFKAATTAWNEKEEGASDRVVIMASTASSAKKVEKGTYFFFAVDSDDVFDVTEASKVLSNQVKNTLTSQHWKVEPAQDGLYRIVSVKNGQALATTGNENEGGKALITVAVAEKDNKQLWKIEETAEDMWKVISAHSNMAATSPLANGEDVVQQYYAGARLQLYTLRAVTKEDLQVQA